VYNVFSMKNDSNVEIADHKKIGQIQDLFLVSHEVGGGLPIFTPKGLKLRNAVADFIVREKEKRGYQFVWTPHIAKSDLYRKSGHWQKYDAMFNPMKLDEEEYVLKPMNCPHHFQVYLSRPRSYRELPMRIAENGTVYRYEKSGEVNGLLRVRSLTIDDTHTFLRHNQIAQELDNVLDLVETVFKTFGFPQYRARISVRDPHDKKKYIGSEENWKSAENALIEAVKRRKIKHSIGVGEAAFYGPKIDVMVKDSLDREWQLSTCQLDFNQPENFSMTYINEHGEKETPAILHIAILGSIERFLGILIEHYAGAFPLWLAPVGMVIIPIAERHVEAAKKIADKLKEAEIRVEVDDRNEPMGAKIRDATLQKTPYMGIIGDKEIESNALSVRTRSGEDLKIMMLDDVARKLQDEIETKR